MCGPNVTIFSTALTRLAADVKCFHTEPGKSFVIDLKNVTMSHFMCRLFPSKCSRIGEEAKEETHPEDPGVFFGGRGLNGPQEEGKCSSDVCVFIHLCDMHNS